MLEIHDDILLLEMLQVRSDDYHHPEEDYEQPDGASKDCWQFASSSLAAIMLGMLRARELLGTLSCRFTAKNPRKVWRERRSCGGLSVDYQQPDGTSKDCWEFASSSLAVMMLGMLRVRELLGTLSFRDVSRQKCLFFAAKSVEGTQVVRRPQC